MNPFEIPFPTTIEALAAIDATREVPLLKALCNRRQIRVPGPNPTPAELIPIIQQHLSNHRAHRPTSYNTCTGEYAEWRQTDDDLQTFLTQLQKLASSPTPVGPGVPTGPRTQVTLPKPLFAPSAPSPKCEMENDQCSLINESEIPSGTQPGTQAVHATSTPESPTTSAQQKISPGTALLQEVEAYLAAHEPKATPKKSKPAPGRRSQRKTKKSPPAPAASPTQPAPSDSETQRLEPSAQHFSPLLSSLGQEISDHLNKTTSPLDDLEPERQQKLYQAINQYGYRGVLRVVTLPAPDGWGLDTSHSSLKRFHDRYERRQQHQQIRDSAQLAREILANPDATDTQLFAAATHLAHVRLLQTANNPKSTIRDLKDLFQIQIRLKSLDIAQQRLNKLVAVPLRGIKRL